jgi:penicillin-binding protein 1A
VTLVKILKYGLIAAISLLLAAVIALGGLYLYLSPQLPSIEGLSDVRLQVPLRIYSSDGALMGEFGEKRRTPKALEEIPKPLRQAFLAAEDDRFFSHPGVDYQGLLRAAVNLIKTGERGQGGSTITMQLARNFYLSTEKTYIRKLSEIFLAIKIERELNKEKILELYLNKIYLGNRAYGVAAAAQVYYGKSLEELSLAQVAMIAGLPKAPSRYNPIIKPERALTRRDYVLGRMHHLEYISDEAYEQARIEPVTAERHSSRIQVQAPYVNEMVRAEIVKQFGDEAYTRGLNVFTTVKDKLQTAANDSVWNGLVAYDERHGYRGPVRHVELHENEPDISLLDNEDALMDILKNDTSYGRFEPALVLAVNDAEELGEVTGGVSDEAAGEQEENAGQASIMLKNGNREILPWKGMVWARTYQTLNRLGDKPESPKEILKPGDVIWVFEMPDGSWKLAQVPEVQGALVSVTPNDGAIQALVGGFNFKRSNFNRATQAKRQAGSGFKPVIYSAALSKSFTAASLINDAPVVFEDAALEASWRPENYSGKFFGPTRLREALYKSRNLVSIRLLRSVGVEYATRYARKFGFNDNKLPHDLSLALGSSEASPLEMTRAYSVLANGGYLIQPYFIQRIEDADGAVLFEADPAVACVSCELSRRRMAGRRLVQVVDESNATDTVESVTRETTGEEEVLDSLPKQAEQTMEPRVNYLMNSILQDVVLRGTGRRALSLGRRDLAGKTGTTNDQKDAWFNGYHPDLVATAWVGFDQLKPLGNAEHGARAALPIWIEYMKKALAGVPEKRLPRPEGLVNVKINAETGEAATDLDKNTIFEIFRTENAPVAGESVVPTAPIDPETGTPIPEQLF